VDEDGKYQMDDMMDEDDIAEDEEDNSDDTTGDKAAKTFLMPFVVRRQSFLGFLGCSCSGLRSEKCSVGCGTRRLLSWI